MARDRKAAHTTRQGHARFDQASFAFATISAISAASKLRRTSNSRASDKTCRRELRQWREPRSRLGEGLDRGRRSRALDQFRDRAGLSLVMPIIGKHGADDDMLSNATGHQADNIVDAFQDIDRDIVPALTERRH